jgi:hypothetical protein
MRNKKVAEQLRARVCCSCNEGLHVWVGGTTPACLPSGACRPPGPCRPASKAGKECPFLSLVLVVLFSRSSKVPSFPRTATTPSLLTEPRRTRAGQGSSAAVQCMPDCQSVRENGKGRVGGHLAAQARPPELQRTFGRLHLVQRTGTLLGWAKKDGGEGSHIIPSHPLPIRSFRDGVFLLTYNSPSCQAGKTKI